MRALRAAVAIGLVALAASACGSGHHTTFSAYSNACGLSVPRPADFHRRFWSASGAGGVTIGDGVIGRANTADWSEDPSQVDLGVDWGIVYHGPPSTPAELRLPLSLDDLDRGSGGLTLWRGVFRNGDQECGIQVWLGPHAPSADRSAVLSALQAIKASH